MSALQARLLTTAMIACLVAPSPMASAWADPKPGPAKSAPATPPPAPEAPKPTHFTPDSVSTDGSVTVGGKRIDYTAIAGRIVVHPKGWDDVPQDQPDDKDKPPIEAAMFYVAYIKKGVAPETRPITFLFNGGPGSSTVWLHMGAFGPRRVVTVDDSHTPAAPYSLVNNDQSLLDASDLVFVDAPGTGFGRIGGPEHDKDKAFFGIDQDAHAFASFISSFLGKYNRWNSPKYLFGESYGTVRSSVLSYMLENDWEIDLNGVILLSQILAFDNSLDGPEGNPGIDVAYEVSLPSYTAVAWYHHKLPPEANPPANDQGLPALLAQVEKWSLGDYAAALAAGAALDPARRDAIARQLHLYTGLSVEYIKRANLRIDGGEFEQNLQLDTETTTGRLDARFSGPAMDPLAKEAEYDPQSAAISSAYVSAFNDYSRRVLKYGDGQEYKPEIRADWDFTHHQQPGQDGEGQTIPNVMPDLAGAIKNDPLLHVQLNQGYYDLATPYFEGIYEMHHLPMPAKLQSNIEFRQYDSGHMVYAHQASLQQLHDNVANFIGRTDNQSH
jgi:carboxypeptidase C (cathepsin A)